MPFRLIVFALLLLIPFAVQAQQSAEVDKAQQIIQKFISGDIAAIYTQFGDQIKGAITQDQLGQVWPQLVGALGSFQQVTDAQENIATRQVTLTLQFERGTFDFSVTFGSAGEILSLTFTPTANAPIPPYADPSAYSETAVTVGDLKLPGVLTMPKGAGPFPAVVLVSGSGPNDADESVGPHKVFRDIAWGLADQGVATLRFSKRTRVFGASLDYSHFTVKDEYVDDSVAAIEVMRTTQGIDPARVFIFGHSEGGYIAPRIAQADPNVAGVIIAAGLAGSLPEAALRQLEYITSLNAQTPDATEDPAIAAMEAEVKKIDALTADSPSNVMVFHGPPSYWLDLRGYDPVALEASLPQPVLVLQGGRDYQVTMADDLPKWQAGLANHADTTFKVYPDLNHIFVTGTGMATPAEYAQPGNVAQPLIDDVATWVKAH